MKGKLIKTQLGYQLFDEDMKHITSLATKGLSLKNCQAIERGYDLDVLANLYGKDDISDDIFFSFKAGFQKCLELLGDKRFTERDMYIFGEYVWKYSENTHPVFDNPLGDKGVDEILEPKTEWDVEIVEECLDPTCDGVNRKGECITTGKPKLDADGCRILKRINN